MQNDELYDKFLREGRPGHAVIRKFFFRYADVLAKINITDVNDVVHEIFLSLSKTDFGSVNNTEHYVHRAVKLSCWSMLDKALRAKSRQAEIVETEEKTEILDIPDPARTNQLTAMEGMELLVQVNRFKMLLQKSDQRLLNLLIDEADRSEMAKIARTNLNTLDTHIRRLRVRLAEFLTKQGYADGTLRRFTKKMKQ